MCVGGGVVNIRVYIIIRVCVGVCMCSGVLCVWVMCVGVRLGGWMSGGGFECTGVHVWACRIHTQCMGCMYYNIGSNCSVHSVHANTSGPDISTSGSQDEAYLVLHLVSLPRTGPTRKSCCYSDCGNGIFLY